MKRVIESIWMFMLLGAPTYAGEIVVHVGPQAGQAPVIVMLFDSADAFAGLRTPLRVQRAPDASASSVRFSAVPAGNYALVAYRDENRNGALDRNFIGIPIEPLAFSNHYRPKGPPQYARAAFMLEPDTDYRAELTLRPVLGKRGRIGVGLGVIARSSPYRDYDAGIYQVIPAITYTGERIQIFGPSAQVGLVGSGRVRLGLQVRYRMGAYEAADSPFLAGMDDREDTLLAGPGLECELPARFELSLAYRHDVLDRIGGGIAKLELARSFQTGRLRIAPQLGATLLTSEIANHDFGVAPEDAAAARPAYRPDAAYETTLGVTLLSEITDNALFVLSSEIAHFSSAIRDSPIVEKDYVISGFAAVNYLF